jgi:hypothetical protein
MPSSATPSPLDQLAGIEQTLSEAAAVLTQGSRGAGCNCHECEVAGRCDAAAATLATLREVLKTCPMQATKYETMEAYSWVCREFTRRVRDYLLSTPDSPRQAGEEITDGN